MEETIRKQTAMLEELSEAEKAYARQFSEDIDIMDSRAVLQYGMAAQKKIMQFSEASLFEIPSADQEEIAKDIRKLKRKLAEFRSQYERSTLKPGSEQALTEFKSIYDSFSSVLIEAARRMQIHRSSLLRHVSRLDKHYETCLKIIREFDLYLYAGKIHLETCREDILQELHEKAEKTKAMQDLEIMRDYSRACLRFEKKLSDLSVSRALPFQTIAQIRLMQNNTAALAENLNRLCTDTFPLYRSRLVFSLGLSDEKIIASETFEEVCDDLNRTLNAILKMQTESREKEKKGLSLFG